MTEGGADVTCLRARIHGRVQGVFYRAWTEETARALGLSGWVRNRRDGTVEALFCGPPAVVAEMLRLAHDGPPLARVARIDTTPAKPPDDPGFHVLPTM